MFCFTWTFFVYIFYLVGLSSVLRSKRDTPAHSSMGIVGRFFWDGYPYIHGTGVREESPDCQCVQVFG